MKNQIKKTESILKNNYIIIEHINFIRKKQDIANELNFDINFKKEVQELDENNYKVLLSISMNDTDNVEIDLTISGGFEITSDITEEMKYNLIHKSTLSILFPYLRSELTLITSQPGFEPIILPPININSLVNELEK